MFISKKKQPEIFFFEYMNYNPAFLVINTNIFFENM